VRFEPTISAGERP